MQQQVRKFYIERLGESLERKIYNEIYYEAMNRKIPLIWNNLFVAFYTSQMNRIITNIDINPLCIEIIQSSANILKLRDDQLNDQYKSYNIKATYVNDRYLTDIACPKCREFKMTIAESIRSGLDEGKSTTYTCQNCKTTIRQR